MGPPLLVPQTPRAKGRSDQALLTRSELEGLHAHCRADPLAQIITDLTEIWSPSPSLSVSNWLPSSQVKVTEGLKPSSPVQLVLPLRGGSGGRGQRTVRVQFGQSLPSLTGVSYCPSSLHTTARDQAAGSTWLSSSKNWPGAQW